MAVTLVAMIRFADVTKRYGDDVIAVDRLTLTAPEGQITVLVGPSGCGKTTTLRMVNRMIEPSFGRIELAGRDTAELDQATLRRGIGYVIQHGGLFPHQSVERNVMTVPLLLGWGKSKARDRARALLDTVGLAPELAARYPGQLSGGQQQRVGVARALAADPPVLLMDEPFSAVDPVVRDQLQDELLALQGQLRKTILFVTHDIDEAIRLGDQVAVLRVGGRLAQAADPATVLTHPADDFVAEFVGRDRGYRSLGFVAARVPVHEEAAVPLEAPGSAAQAVARDGWVLVVDEQHRPQGWVRPDRIGDVVRREDLALGGTLATEGGSLRAHLDAALSSPSQRGVVVDASGCLVGTVRAVEVLTAIDAARNHGDAGDDRGQGHRGDRPAEDARDDRRAEDVRPAEGDRPARDDRPAEDARGDWPAEGDRRAGAGSA